MAFLRLIYLLFIFLFSSSLSSIDTEIRNTSLLRGPGPVFSLGHNIFPKNQLIIEEELFYVKITPDSSSLINFNIIYYGITNRWSALITIPTILKDSTIPNTRSRGLGNIVLQSEYAFYEVREPDALTQFTILANVIAPTTQVIHNLDILNTKASSYFLGVTTNHLSSLWYTYSDIGVFFTTKRHQLKLGNELWYGLGVGRKLFENGALALAGIIEMSGIYERPDTIGKSKFLGSGGNRLYLGGSLRIYYGAFVFISGFQPIIADVTREDVSFKYRSIISASYVF